VLPGREEAFEPHTGRAALPRAAIPAFTKHFISRGNVMGILDSLASALNSGGGAPATGMPGAGTPAACRIKLGSSF